jgi:hypothetical protein
MDLGAIHIRPLRDQEQIDTNLTAMIHDRYIMVMYCAKKNYIYFDTSNARRKGDLLAAFSNSFKLLCVHHVNPHVIRMDNTISNDFRKMSIKLKMLGTRMLF